MEFASGQGFCYLARAMIALLVLTASAGLLISIYFTLLYYRVISPTAKVIPRVCRLGEGGCAAVLGHPHARLFGLPNAVYGIFYYCMVLIVAFGPGGEWFKQAAVVVSVVVVGLGVFLVHSLLFVVRVHCILCYASHTLNFLLAILLVTLMLPR